MNFNLASPSNNGHEFTIQFREHVSIEKDSTVSLNFAELVRDRLVTLKQDAVIRLTVDEADMLPNLVPADNSPNKAFGNQLSNYEDSVIPAGRYSFNEFRDQFQIAFESIVDTSNLNYEGYSILDNPDVAILTIGIQPPPINAIIRPGNLKDYAIDGTHSHDAVAVDSGGIAVAYTTTNVANAYDNYAIADTHYNHYIDNASLGIEQTRAENNASTTANNAYLYCESIKNVGQQDGSSWIGLYSKEYAEGIVPAVAGRTTGDTAPALDANGRPKCFFGVEFNTDGTGVGIYYARNTAGALITEWDSINQDIEVMVQVHNIGAASWTPTEKFKLVIGTEIDNSKNTPEIIVKVAGIDGDDIDELWDSNQDHKNLPNSLMVGNITYDNANALNSQIPFNWFASVKSSSVDNGFKYLKYKNFPKNYTTPTGVVLSDTNPASYAKKISLSLGTVLSRAIGVPETIIIRPNQSTLANPLVVSADLNFTWLNQSYSILVDLPLNNFKNKGGTANTRANAAVKQQVLANIVAPFTNLSINQGNAISGQEVSTLYQPFQPIVSKMRNNQIEINAMSFQVVDMLTEEPADDIERCVINFTIE
tara:strand:- start:778 stop:2556 length:1779 start_codon:yes stop_codon:yes gene_type:complete